MLQWVLQAGNEQIDGYSILEHGQRASLGSTFPAVECHQICFMDLTTTAEALQDDSGITAATVEEEDRTAKPQNSTVPLGRGPVRIKR